MIGLIDSKEIWLPIKYNLNFQISNFGRIKSLQRFAKIRYGFREVKERILNPTKFRKCILWKLIMN